MAQTRPKDVKALRRFLGMTGFYRRFIKGYTDIAKPLTQLLGAKVPFHWGREEQDSYDTLVQSLQEDPVLITPDWNKGFILETDASKYAIGGVLMQSDSQGRYHIICYGSKKLTPAQQRWSAVEREIYAGVHFLQAYRYYLDSGVVASRTDSKPFSYIVRQRDITGRFSHWLAILQSFGGLTVVYKTGPSNVVADYLSRDVAAIAVSPVQAWRFDQLEDLKRAQKEDEELCHWFRKGTKPSGTSYESLLRWLQIAAIPRWIFVDHLLTTLTKFQKSQRELDHTAPGREYSSVGRTVETSPIRTSEEGRLSGISFPDLVAHVKIQ
ncbi:hypothetical protein FOZ60_007179 [Perkinsus olseni]|uniref:Reverse transcriptase RNase H-like domain-containing protein n=1 Tax=Perkinsus olseni TaxID=32597 RepID=A0A7J6NPA1_PEROL|nr:hypothetical protein FOZ60_007179 [Perkinsus olseni]